LVGERTRDFLHEAGSAILLCTILMWGLLQFPRTPPPTDLDAMTDVEAAAWRAESLEHSAAGQVGKAIEPVLKPLGFDWKIGVGLIGAFAAREVFVSTMGLVYGVGEDVDEASLPLRDRIRADAQRDGTPTYTPLVGLSLMVFFALAAQCMSTLAVVRRETRSWRWPAFLFVYMTTLAWSASFIVYQGGRWLGLPG
jgi:ferrous iron transport protein B